MKKILAFLLCGLLFSVTTFAKIWNLGDEGTTTFTLDVDDTITQLLEDLGITEDVIKSQLAAAGINLNDYTDEWTQISQKVQSALDDYVEELNENEALKEASAIIPTVKNGFYDFADALAYAIQDSSSLQNTESAAWIGYFIFPGLHFRLGLDASVATLDINPLIKMTDALGYNLDLSDATDAVSHIPIVGNYKHHVVFPTVALNARLGGLSLPFIKLPFDLGLSLLSIDTRGNLDSLWPSEIGEKFNVDYLTFGMDFRYKLFKLGPSLMNLQISGMTGIYYTKGNVEAAVDQGSASFDFNQLSGMLGAQVTGHLVFVDAFFGTKLLTNIKSKVSLKARPNWENILEIDDANAMKIACAMMPEEIGFSDKGGWSDSFELNPVFYGGLGLSAKIIRLGLAASYNVTSENLGATVNVRFSW